MMKQPDRNTVLMGGSAFVGGVILGMVAGAVLGVLFAPHSGEDTRKELCKQADELGETIKDKGEDALKAGKSQLNAALQRHSVIRQEQDA